MLASRSGGPRYAVGLTRVSTAEQGQSSLGLEAQQASVRAFIEAQGWTLVAEYSDVASGKEDRRPGFQTALARCRQLGAILVAARLDRITRRAHTLSQLLEDGYSIRTADMPGADDLMMRIYAAMAQKERELISGRTRAALAAAKAREGVGWRSRLSAGGGARRRGRGLGAAHGVGAIGTPTCVGDRSAARDRRNVACCAGAGADRARRADAARHRLLDAYDCGAGGGEGGSERRCTGCGRQGRLAMPTRACTRSQELKQRCGHLRRPLLLDPVASPLDQDDWP